MADTAYCLWPLAVLNTALFGIFAISFTALLSSIWLLIAVPAAITALSVVVTALGAALAWAIFRNGTLVQEQPAGPIGTAGENLHADAFDEAVFEKPGSYPTRGLVYLDNQGIDWVAKPVRRHVRVHRRAAAGGGGGGGGGLTGGEGLMTNEGKGARR